MSAIGGSQAKEGMRQGRNIQRSFDSTLRAAYQNDPLMNMILGSLTKYQGAAFDPQELYQRGTEQIEKVRQRREFDAQRMLAQQGLAGDVGQGQYASRALGVAQQGQNQALSDLITQASIQERPQRLGEDFGALTSLLGQNLSAGANLGILGQVAATPPPLDAQGYVSPLASVMSGQEYRPLQDMQRSYLPPGLQGNFSYLGG
jgi:hypothetical protein